jgi:hypothetical protein
MGAGWISACFSNFRKKSGRMSDVILCQLYIHFPWNPPSLHRFDSLIRSLPLFRLFSPPTPTSFISRVCSSTKIFPKSYSVLESKICILYQRQRKTNITGFLIYVKNIKSQTTSELPSQLVQLSLAQKCRMAKAVSKIIFSAFNPCRVGSRK